MKINGFLKLILVCLGINPSWQYVVIIMSLKISSPCAGASCKIFTYRDLTSIILIKANKKWMAESNLRTGKY